MKKILIIKPGAIGDLLHLTPVIRALKEKWPDAHVCMLVGNTFSVQLFRHNPLVDDIKIFDKRGAHRSLRAMVGLWKDLRKERYDLVLNFQRSNMKVWLLVSAAFPCRLLVYHKARRRTVHAIINHLETLKPLGIDPARSSLRLEFFPSADDEKFAADIFGSYSSETKFIAFNPGTNHQCKCWPIDRFAALGDLLVEKLGAHVVILGSRAEKRLAEQIAAGMHHVPIDVTGCSLGELGAILKRVTLLVTGDTGPMHIASAVATPIVALHGPISAERSAPLGEMHRVIMHDELHCCPCNSFTCRNKVFRECMEMITVDEVFAAIGEILGAMPNIGSQQK